MENQPKMVQSLIQTENHNHLENQVIEQEEGKQFQRSNLTF